jgi:hypothetical protein
MTATTATDPSAGVQYNFDETSGNAGGTDSGWQSSSSYTDSGLSCGTMYTYRVQTRDALSNTGSWSTSQSATTNACSAEILDQQQTQATSNNILYASRWGGQSFTPTKSVLTRVELYIRKVGNPPSALTLSVRSSLTGADLVKISKPASQITRSFSWVEFNFNDLTVTPGSTYYLILRNTGGSITNSYYWGYGTSNPYTNGVYWLSLNSGSTWKQSATYDFCFKTYGM